MTIDTYGESAVADHFGRSFSKVQDESCVLIDPEHVVISRKFLFHESKASLSEVAETRVVVTALGIVVVRNDDSINTDSAKDVEAIKPVGVVATLINFVHRNRVGTDCQRCGGSEDDDASLIKFVGNDVGYIGIRPLAKCIGG